MTLEAKRVEITKVRIELKLPEENQFNLGELKVVEVSWEPAQRLSHSHPIECKTVRHDIPSWNIRLQMNELPQEIKTALISACIAGDI